MKKKVLSLILVLSMLLSAFTVFATGASAAEGTTPESSQKSTGSHIDLYVKEGLVALFDGFPKCLQGVKPRRGEVNRYLFFKSSESLVFTALFGLFGIQSKMPFVESATF